MHPHQDHLDSIRAQRTELENHLIDELRAGKIGRREFVRRGAVVGMSVPLLSFLATACGVSKEDLEAKDKPQTAQPKPGGTIRIGQQEPPGALDPVSVNNQGGLMVLGQTGEYLIWSDRNLKPLPRLADELEAQRGRQRVDLQAPRGGQVPRRQGDGRRGRGHVLRPPRRSGQRLERAVGVHRRAVEGWRQGGRRDRRWSSTWTLRTATSRSSRAPTTTTRSSCPRTTRATGRRRSSAPVPGSSTASAPARVSRWCPTRTTGTRAAAP